jgi:ATP-binding cassette subfamily B multidrug efflux pump
MKDALKLARFLRPYWRWAVLAPLFMLLEVTMDLMQPRLVERIVDEGIARLDLNLVLHTGLLMAGLALIGAVGGIGCAIFAETAGVGFGADLREYLFRKVLTYSFGNLDELDTGQLVTRLTNDVTQVQEAVTMMQRILVRSPLLLVGSLVMAILTSPQLVFIPLLLMPIELVAVVWIIRKATPMFSLVQQRLDALNEVMQENLAGVRVVKAFVRARHEARRFAVANTNLTRQTVSVGRLVAIMPAFMMLTLNLGVIAVLWFGGLQVTAGQMQVGQIIAFISYLSTTLFALMMVSQLIIQFARAGASAGRIVEVIEKEPQVQNPPTPLLDWTPHGQVTFDRVTFQYNGHGSDPVLKRISFTAQPGETVAILGTTGAGKTSLVNLIPRFYDPTGGEVRIDGVDVRRLDQDVLRRSIGVALQDVELFSGSVRDNIRYGRPNASDEEVVAAAQAAQAHEFITAFPAGYDTQIGQRGVNLSGGQKQRIAIARALLLQPAILILDDSTSSVDVETEVQIQSALETLMRDRTSFVIAQRISTVLTADKILVLDDGQIVAQGDHHSLLTPGPGYSRIYREIYESQLGDGVVP